METRNSGEDDRWKLSKLPRTMDQRSPKVFLMERHDRGFPWSRTTHQRKEGGVAESYKESQQTERKNIDTSEELKCQIKRTKDKILNWPIASENSKGERRS